MGEKKREHEVLTTGPAQGFLGPWLHPLSQSSPFVERACPGSQEALWEPVLKDKCSQNGQSNKEAELVQHSSC